MKLVKRLCIWLAGMLVILLLVTIASTILVKKFGADVLLPTYYGYARKMDFPLPEAHTEKEQQSNHMTLGMRALLCDSRMDLKPSKWYHHLLFENYIIDESIVFVNHEGMHDLSTGVYASVYDHPEEVAPIIHTIGIIRIGNLIPREGADALYNALKEQPDAEVHLNSYTIENDLIQPVSVTLYSPSGSEITTIEFPAGGNVIQADDCRIDNTYDEQYPHTSLWKKLELAYRGERRSDQIAAKLAETLPLDETDYSEDKIQYGFLMLTAEHLEVREHLGMVLCDRFYFGRAILPHLAVLGVIWTVIFLLVCGKKNKSTAKQMPLSVSPTERGKFLIE